MYIFVRFSAIITILFGILLMLTGAGSALYGFFQNDVVSRLINDWLEQSDSLYRVLNAGYLGVIIGLVLFIVGMFTAALGQLLIIFADLAANTRETNVLLRSLRAQAPIKQTQPAPNKQPEPEKTSRPAETPNFFDEEEAYG